VGSGITPANMPAFTAADALIVGSSVKQGGLWCNALDPDRLRAVAQAFHSSP
jgi:predicted TIM-barrel enzyme